MIRKTLTILSLIGLLLSVGLWGVSCHGLAYIWNTTESEGGVGLLAGGFEFHSHQRHAIFSIGEPLHEWGSPKVKLRMRWVPDLTPEQPFRGWHDVFIPFWIPTLVCGLIVSFLFYVPFSRRRKRKKLGLCLKCGYDLRGSKGTCPECGQEFE